MTATDLGAPDGANPGPASLDTDERRPLLVALGERVRTLRLQRGLTRKAASRAAGVSERHFANLELGTGNPSFLFLAQVAVALQCPLGDLVGPVAAAGARSRRVALIGLRGAGKSTLGPMLAQDLGVPFIELGHEVETLAGCSIREIHDLYGTAAYRRYERRALEAVIERHAEAVIATPGGLVTEAATLEVLLAQCTAVWLQADPHDHMNRVLAQGDLRPMAASSEAMDDLRRILDTRSPAYARAPLSVHTSRQSLPRTFALLRECVRRALGLPLSPERSV